ncbi:MAG TPA: PAS domain-containing sensor histidine kinase [Gillisia sp.]|nr:PAS domain-containing sensor histidine kinase [Gillisia sp.]
MLNDLQLNSILEDFDIAYWKIDLLTKEITWSEHFTSLVGSPAPENSSFDHFINQVLHRDYRYDFRVAFENLLDGATGFNQEVKLKLQNDKYRWFECRNLKSRDNTNKETAVLLFVNIHQSKRDQYTIEENFFYYRETAEMTSTGGWYVDTVTKAIYWDDVTKRILDCPQDFHLSYDERLRFYGKEHQERALALFEKCEKYGIPFKEEIKMVTLYGREFWVRATGKPVYNEEQEIIGIRGVFQDIDENKNNEINLQNSLDIIATQNSRLFNFAHVVSHNLRSHSSNLSLVVQLVSESREAKEKIELLDNIASISENLDIAITQLNDMVSHQNLLKKERRQVTFSSSLDVVVASISSLINRESAKIVSDFSNLKEIMYIPEYLESILLNLITNAIRYKQPGRKPVIFLQSYLKNDQPYLEVSDNGMGIDLDRHGDKMFGMYKTFHHNPDAKGIGLFITRNQVETMGGTISVTSTVNIGTTFKIKF